ncbi:anaerobic ribonucleoside-triphosphate reductase [Bilophila wadsworthia]|jgi:ribonucleoside-triphosphate reductase|uniref:anaerobic ribonucleoside-triphosphate reductase n=1 Tax=Bilophila wadsworthia TaxID=35833 RepID=UPI00266DA003|nr:anaerobic ribonucleoside-triphosphate reductase [Bilophila wadsworthia]
MIRLPQSYDEGFCSLLERLRSAYPAELFRLEGIHPDQLDINAVSRDYFKTSDRKGSATADHSIDPNANVSGRDVITFNYEVPKSLMKLNSLYNLWKTMKDLYGRDDADQAIEHEINGTLYINDVWDIGRPYCFNYSTYDIALEGLNMGGRLTIDPPKSLNAFLRQVEQFTVYAANSTLGATGLADLLIVVSRYVDDILTTGYDHHVKIGKAPRVWTYVKESLTSLIYTLNWEFRGNQSPFTNVSVYDRLFLEQLVPSYLIGGTAPDIETVEKVQDLFLDAYNETLARTPITFPVVTACFSAGQGSDGGGRTIQDKAFLKKIARHNLKYGFINIYCGESSTLSSCCRLRSSISDLGYSNTFGAGSTKIGSLGVVTLNLPRLARTAEGSFPAFLGLLRQSTGTASRINHAKRTFIKDRIERGSLPLYTLGFMDLSRQYSTCGFTGLHEAMSILGFDMLTEEGLQAAEDTLTVINETNAKLSKLLGTPHNMEQVPAESSAVKLAKKDALLGLNPEGIPLYSNQFLPLWEEGADLLDRIRVQGRLDGHCTGGAICHLNVATAITDPAVMEALIHHAAESGAVYFAVNYQINRCAQGHMTVGRDDACPVCGAPVIDTFTRVVGFLTNTKHWNKTRREHDWPERTFAEHA